MAVKDASVEGAIITANERFFIQPARSLSKSAGEDEFVFYESSELIEDAGSCGVTLADEVAQQEVNLLRFVTSLSSDIHHSFLGTLLSWA